MSFNISTRLNNLQQQINNIANKGLTNPLEQILDANNYTLTNLNILDGGANKIEIKTNNVDGVVIDNDTLINGNLTVDILNYTSLNPPVGGGGSQNLQQTLTNGNDAGELDIINVKNITSKGEINTTDNIFCNQLNVQFTGNSAISCSGQIVCENLDCANNIFCGELSANIVRYTTLDPPITGSGNLETVLTAGNNANDIGIDNLGTINITSGHINIANYDALGEDTQAYISLNNISTVPFYLTYGDPQGTTNQKFRLMDSNEEYINITNSGTTITTISAELLLRKKNSSNISSNTGYILDSLYNTPMYRQIFSNLNQSITFNNTQASSYIFGVNIYTGDSTNNYGINCAEILFSYLQINFTSDDPFLAPNNCQLYISNSPNASFDPDKGNRIIFSVVDNAQDQPNYTFTSSVPIIFYFQNDTQFSEIYLNIAIQDEQTYYINITNTNMMVSGYITYKNTESLIWHS